MCTHKRLQLCSRHGQQVMSQNGICTKRHIQPVQWKPCGHCNEGGNKWNLQWNVVVWSAALHGSSQAAKPLSRILHSVPIPTHCFTFPISSYSAVSQLSISTKLSLTSLLCDPPYFVCVWQGDICPYISGGIWLHNPHFQFYEYIKKIIFLEVLDFQFW